MNMRKPLRPSPTALLNPRSDPTFKTLFTQNTPESNDALRDLISAMLGKAVRSIKLLPNEPPKKSRTEKQMAFDVHCVLENGEPAEIEMQGRDKEHSYAGRAEAHAARLLAHATRRGESWKDIPKVYQLSVLNFTYDSGDKSAFSWYTMRKKASGRNEDEKGLSLNERLNVIYLELTKIRRLRHKPVAQLTKLERWGMFLAYADKPEMQEYLHAILAAEECIMKANEILEEISVDEANWYLQNAYDDWERDQLEAAALKEENAREYQKNVQERQKILQDRQKLTQDRQKIVQDQQKLTQDQQKLSQEQEMLEQEKTMLEREKHLAMERGVHAHAKETAKRLLGIGLSETQVAESVGLSIEEVRQLQQD